MSEETAAAFRDKLVTQVYPELETYLEQSQAALRHNLKEPGQAVPQPHHLRRVFKGKESPADSRGWFRLKPYARKLPSRLARDLESDKPSEDLERWLTAECVASLTGRLRGGCLYSVSKNTPFQALASDGAKQALWDLFDAGFRVVAFVHDEFVVELPEADAARLAPIVDGILNAGMESALGGSVPSKVEGHASPRWSK